jgi:hypothetical protein
MESPIPQDVKQGKEWLTIPLESDASIVVGAIAIVADIERGVLTVYAVETT